MIEADTRAVSADVVIDGIAQPGAVLHFVDGSSSSGCFSTTKMRL